MQVNLKRAGSLAVLTATGSPDEIAELLRITGTFGMDWRQNAQNGALVAFGFADDVMPPESDEARH